MALLKKKKPYARNIFPTRRIEPCDAMRLVAYRGNPTTGTSTLLRSLKACSTKSFSVRQLPSSRALKAEMFGLAESAPQ
jgi:hypothetical protein